jgi:DNA-binding protein HU-beta
VNRAELIEAVSARLGDRKSATAAVDALLDTVTRTVAKGERVAIAGFGVFEKLVRPARFVRNPRTGERIRAKKSAVPRFRPGAGFKDAVSGERKLEPLAPVAAPAKKAATKRTAKATTAKAAPARKAAASTAAPAKKATKAAAKKTTAKKAATKKAVAKKVTPTKAAPAKKATAKKTAAKKTAVKATAKKTATKKAATKKAAARGR